MATGVKDKQRKNAKSLREKRKAAVLQRLDERRGASKRVRISPVRGVPTLHAPFFSMPAEARYLIREARKEDLTPAESAALDTAENLLKAAAAPAPAPNRPSLETQVFDVEEPWMTTLSCELYLALCKKSKKYAALVSKLKRNGGYLIGAIGLAVASAVGFAMGAVAALVATILALISKIGLEAWCKRMTASRKCEGVS